MIRVAFGIHEVCVVGPNAHFALQRMVIAPASGWRPARYRQKYYVKKETASGKLGEKMSNFAFLHHYQDIQGRASLGVCGPMYVGIAGIIPAVWGRVG